MIQVQSIYAHFEAENLPDRYISMANQRIFLQLHKPSTKLQRPFAAGATIVFLSTSFDGNPDKPLHLDNTSVNLEHGNDILLQISIRRGDNRIDLDTFRNGRWDRNLQSISLSKVFSGPGATIGITATTNSYEITFDGSPVIHTFKKRIDVNATAISYRIDNERRVFSDPLIVEVFDPRVSGQFISLIPFF